ncbi:hypothetical protein [Roseibium aggregatum]|uniref:hypothetical protein n=1 Tax=Roseibium aggregatum TaxID=187304 RepID=UPI0011A1F63F|nr:hypothetical protein [Roseibium aggregatum]
MSTAAIAQVATDPAPQTTPSEVPAEIVDYCDFAPKAIGETCLEIIQKYEADGVDPTITARAVAPVKGDTVITSPDWSAALLIRETARGARAAAWPDGKSSEWMADLYSEELVIAKADSNLTPDVGVTAGAAGDDDQAEGEAEAETEVPEEVVPDPDVADTPASHPTPATPIPVVPPKLTEGWITDLTNNSDYVLASYYDNDGSWFSSDIPAVMPVPNVADALAFKRKAKMIVSEDGGYEFNFTITAPEFNDIKPIISGHGSGIFAKNQAALCEVKATLDGTVLMKQKQPLELRGGSAMTVKSAQMNLQKGLYDVVLETRCTYSDWSVLGARRIWASTLKQDPTKISFGYSLSIKTDAAEPRFAVKTDELMTAFDSAKRPAVFLAPKPSLPVGYGTGWILEEHKGSRNGAWPTYSGEYAGTASAQGINLGYRVASATRKNSLMASGLFTASETGSYVFALAPQMAQVHYTNEATYPSERMAIEISARARVETIQHDGPPLVVVRLDSGDRRNAPQFERKTGEAVNIAAYRFDLEAGKTYNLSFLFPYQSRGCDGNDCNKLIDENESGVGGDIRFFVKAPSDPGLRPFKALEVLHKVEDAEVN